MAKITAEILRKIAPQTPAPLRDRFIPYLNSILPRYGIVSELQVAAFLATAAFESMYFRKTKEGKAQPTSTAWIKYQSKYWHTNYMGRGIFQTTSEKNYRIFGQKMKRKGLVTDSELFVKQPQLLEQPEWAVESACEFWETNGLDKYARQGFKGFTALQGVVNRGRADKVALGQADRLLVYEKARLALPDDFILGASTTTANTTATDSNSPTDEPQDTVPPTNIETTTVEAENGVVTSTTTTVQEEAEIEGAKPYNDVGLGGTLKDDAKAILPANFGFGVISEWLQQTAGLPPWVATLLPKLVIALLICTLLWVLYRVITWAKWTWVENERVKLLAMINSDKSRKDIVLK
jgi:putative chitinase